MKYVIMGIDKNLLSFEQQMLCLSDLLHKSCHNQDKTHNGDKRLKNSIFTNYDFFLINYDFFH